MESLLIWGTILAVMVVVVVFYTTGFLRRRGQDRVRLVKTRELGMDKASGQYPQIDVNTCIGCGSCIDACPEGDVLGIVMGKAVVINGARCIGHGKCAEACPVEGIKVGLGDISRRDDIPLLDDHNQTNIPGIYIAGELSGFALISNAVQQGCRVMERIAAIGSPVQDSVGADDLLDAVIVGAGPAGMSAGLVAARHGVSCIILDQQGAGGTILHYPRRKLVMVQPVEIPQLGRLPHHEYSKEELLEIWERLHTEFGLNILTGVRVSGISGVQGDFTVQTQDQVFRGRNVVLALGRRGTPRRLNVPGEELPKVAYQLKDAEAYQGRRVLVVGGGDAAVEAAMGLAQQKGTNVTLSYRKPELLRIKHRNANRIRPLIASGKIQFQGATTIKEIDEDAVMLEAKGGLTNIPNDDVFILAGGIPPFGFLRELGIRFGGDQESVHAAAADRRQGARP